MISPYEQLTPNRPSFIGWSPSSGLVARRSCTGVVSLSGRGSVGVSPRRSRALSVVMAVSSARKGGGVRGPSAHLEGVARAAGELDDHGLLLEVLVDGLHAVLP